MVLFGSGYLCKHSDPSIWSDSNLAIMVRFDSGYFGPRVLVQSFYVGGGRYHPEHKIKKLPFYISLGGSVMGSQFKLHIFYIASFEIFGFKVPPLLVTH